MSPKVLIACLALHCDLFINDAKYAVIAEVGELFRGWGGIHHLIYYRQNV